MKEPTITLYIAGDSTAQTYGDEEFPQTGWGQVLGHYFTPDRVQVANHAAGGRSSKSFILEGRLEQILNEIKPGDYLFIQFGHNDQKNATEEDLSTRYTDPELAATDNLSYKKHLKLYIEGARQKGAFPVLLTSVVRRRFKGGVFYGIEDMGRYPLAMKELAEEMKVPLIDMNVKCARLVESLGEEQSKGLYMHLSPYDERFMGDPRYKNSRLYGGKNHEDNSHFNVMGAEKIARLVAEGIKELELPIAPYIVFPAG